MHEDDVNDDDDLRRGGLPRRLQGDWISAGQPSSMATIT
jgi:hypothetical protein